ncbi:PaaD-like zinc ribbon domain-containing protein [Haladaptatus salinisoli]|jgi:transposase-like protein|uniref:PaaD-like zinc ribbon domain-containing protein n=1 Tax=Haladaptatus salinisoli TaxID=2884876 RepID=UPI003F635CE2
MSAMNGPSTEKDEFEPSCPFCGSTDVERESAFGSEISKTQYYCHHCQTMFERLKYDGKRPDTGR